MSFSEFPPPPEVDPGQDEPFLRVKPPGPASRTWLTRMGHSSAPMGPRRGIDTKAILADVPPFTVVYAKAVGSNVIDVDGNRYVDFAAGFGAQLLGHGHPAIRRVLELQAERLLQALGDVHPSDARIAFGERLAKLHPAPEAQVILGQSGADAVSAALKTAVLFTDKPGVLAFEGAYHGLSYGPLAALGLRPSYREPFGAQLNPHVRFVSYPATAAEAGQTLERISEELGRGDVGAVLFEPILGRGGCIVPPAGFAADLAKLVSSAGALLISDEIWTGLGRSGRMLFCSRDDVVPDLVCLGKGLGGGLPISACIGRREVMAAWSREHEVVHTSTFTGAPLACATGIATLDALSRDALPERATRVGDAFREALGRALAPNPRVREVRGAGMMIGIDLGSERGAAVALCQRLLGAGYLASTGGGGREVLVLTPPLTISEALLDGFVRAVAAAA
jgi:4-aminobutyrate aminotransferase/(S)-3-amino-2-methylpropionate transaminase